MLPSLSQISMALLIVSEDDARLDAVSGAHRMSWDAVGSALKT